MFFVFFPSRPQPLAQFDTKKVMFYTLMERSMLKKIKIDIGSGCRVGLYSNKHISYQGQPKVIAKSNNSSSYNKTIITQFWHLVVIQSKLSSAKDILFICSIQVILAARPIFLFQFGKVETNIDQNIMVMAKGGSYCPTTIYHINLLQNTIHNK